MAYLTITQAGTLKAKSATSNDMLSFKGIGYNIIKNRWDTDLIVESLNLLLAIAGKSATDSSHLSFDATYKKV